MTINTLIGSKGSLISHSPLQRDNKLRKGVAKVVDFIVKLTEMIHGIVTFCFEDWLGRKNWIVIFIIGAF